MSRKNIISAIFFLLLMAATFYTIFKGNNMPAVWAAAKQLQPLYLIGAVLAALFFVSAEGIMIWYLLRSLKCTTTLGACVRYSFIGFFFSGITPSATGGQPVQLYFMKKSGLRIADSTVVLMTVALVYKFVLVVIGLCMLIFCYQPLTFFLKEYIYLFYLGLILNVLLVALLLFVMISPKCFGKIVAFFERLLLRVHILKPSTKRTQKLDEMTGNYREAVAFLIQHKRHVVVVTIITILQRISVFFMTWLIYRGMHLTEHSLMTIMLLQASVYIAVDMLPLPGAQGITELMYKTVFVTVFPGACLTASMCITRGINFYFLLIISGLISAFHYRKTARSVKPVSQKA